jgi:hypothetical protein
MKKSKDTIGNRTRDLPACSALPQPTVPLHAPYWVVNDVYYENFAKVMTTLCEHNEVCLNIQTVVMSTDHCA